MSSAGEKKATELTVDAFRERGQGDRAFYFRHAIKIRPKDARSLVSFEMRPAQQKLADVIDRERAAGRPPRIIILKSRQIGFSTFTEMEVFRRCDLWPHQQALIAAHKAESAEYLFSMVERAYNEMPKPLQRKRKYATKRMIHFKDNDSRLEVQVAEEARGFTAQIVHISELAFIEGAGALMTAVLQVVPDTPESLIILESTPNGIGNEFHNLWVRAASGRNEWVAFFVPWFDDPTYTRPARFTEEDFLQPTANEAMTRAQFIYKEYGLTLDQIAWWLYTLENKCRGDLDVMEQEYPSNDRDCFLASGRRVFQRDGLQHYIAMCGMDAYRDESPDQRRARELADTRSHSIEWNAADPRKPILRPDPTGLLRIYQKPQPRHRYIVSWDLSAGDPGSDPSPGVVLDQHTLDLVAVWYGRREPELCADLAYMLGWYYNRAKINGEANNHGILFHHRLIDELHYPNIFYRKVNEESVSKRESDKPGVWTSGSNREALVNLSRRYVREKAGRVEDERMVREWTMLQFDDNDRVDHPEGEFMDLTMAFSMALAVHSGGYESALAPLSFEDNQAAVEAAIEIRNRKAMGLSIADVDTFGLSHEDIDRIEFAAREHAERRAKHGLGSAT